MEVTFIRHGETTLNKANRLSGRIDCNITQEAIVEINKKCFDKGSFNYVYVSPLKRTHQTAELIYPYCNFIVNDLIIDRNLGEFQGKCKYKISQKLLFDFRHNLYLPKGAETVDETKKRVIDFIDFLKINHDSKDKILVVCHAVIIRMVKEMYMSEPVHSSKNLETFVVNL
jgi:broad specificity phosphatase PhoE